MLKVEINGKQGKVKVEASGSLPELMSDIAAMLNAMYNGMDDERKKDFKSCIEELVEKELYAKTEEEMDKLIEEKKEKFKKIDSFFKGLKDLFGDE